MRDLIRRVFAKRVEILQVVYGLYILTAFLVMLVLGVAGMYEIGRGAGAFVGADAVHAAEGVPEARFATSESASLALVLKGVEFLFLAPIPLMAVYALGRYVFRMYAVDGSELEHAINEVRGVKAFVVSLMIAVIATDLVSRSLSSGGIQYEAAIGGSLVMAVLVGYLVSLEKMS